MVRKRAAFDSLEPAAAPRWRVVRSMQGRVIDARELPAGSNLKHVFVTAMLEHLDAGWRLGEFSSSSGTFFCTRDTERRMVSIDPADPHDTPMYGGAHLGGCRDCGLD